ncbi:chromatin-remodeling ATPase INO80-like isoform X2 [Watersipora subatra]|uniref:chromatin-remodeling ATPase INO80-like isoform X2 n=1 Tax=Watersipora subatra TaxID=2589382 RepID=UPI00355C12D1
MADEEDIPEPAQVMNEHSYSIMQYKPLHVQRLEKTLNLDGLIKATERMVKAVDMSDEEQDVADVNFIKRFKPTKVKAKRDRGRPCTLVQTSVTEKKLMRQTLYVIDNLKYKKKWIRDMLLSDSDSSAEEDDEPITEARFKFMLKEHQQLRKCQKMFSYMQPNARNEFKQYTYGVLGQGAFPKPVSDSEVEPTQQCSKKRPLNKSSNIKSKFYKDAEAEETESSHCNEGDQQSVEASVVTAAAKGTKTKKPPTAEVLLARRKKLWHTIVKKDISKAAKARLSARKELLSNAKKCAVGIQRQKRKEALASHKSVSSIQSRMKRICREVVTYWKRFEKVEKMQMKKVQKEAQEQRKQDLNLLEAKRQARKLNFLITQTELYAHFMANKITGSTEADKAAILSRLEDKDELKLHNDALDDYDADEVKDQVLHNAEDAYVKHTSKTEKFDKVSQAGGSLSNPVGEADYPQPSIFVGKLKTYQIKGMNWLADLYSQGINGILADEMGLGKTVQSIAFLAHLAEVHGIWGPFLVVAPASTLHNWQQESARFLPKMRVVPYWGTTQERKILRTFWDQKNLHTEDASFHVVITSYQLIIQDYKYFSRLSWHYMVLDEAQALKSSSSNRWKTLLSFNCRNRLLLTGTPIQNSMAELWALLHFIMPTLFDSHEEFNEWFSKDIESSAEKGSTIDQNHLSRLHMILKPFMLRRIKKDVENDLTDKIEVLVYCPLTIRQRYLYDAIKRKISIEDLLAGVTQAAAASNTTNSLMNLVMQFRKVCNHPELFDRRDVKSPAYVSIEPYLLPKLIYRDGLLDSGLSSRQHLLYRQFYLHNSAYVHERSLCSSSEENLFSWMRLVGVSAGQLYNVMYRGLFHMLRQIALVMAERHQLSHDKLWHSNSSFVNRRLLLVSEEAVTDPTHRDTGSALSSLIFTNYESNSYGHLTHSHYYMKETPAHRKIRLRDHPELLVTPVVQSPVKKRQHKSHKAKSPPPAEDVVGAASSTKELGRYHHEEHRLHRTVELQLTEMPLFLSHLIPKAVSPSLQCYCYDRSAQYELIRRLQCSSPECKQLLRFGNQPSVHQTWHSKQSGGLEAINPPYGFSNIYIPDKRSMIVDAGKMHVLDELLTKLKKEGHRVLIYSTMTKVIDLLEEFMWYRKHQYMRLDGSSKISERRDMVSDFQNKADIFVFLLSTRAGGLGINLTAADTVIFYDSDWNPTVDAQAMDRAHRLGQTKQVTVYRLICKGTIEERILERAREKSEIQRMVISGHNDFKPDVLKAKEVVSLLIDDEGLKQKIEQAQDSKLERAEKRKHAAALKKAEGPKPKRVRKSGTSKSSRLSKSATPNDLGSNHVGEDEEMEDLVIDCVNGTRASTPVNSSAPSTPSGRSSTPVVKTAKTKGRAKGSGSLRVRTSASMKKALNAAEIAGTNAAYAAVGITPSNKKETGSKLKKGR